MSYSYTAKIIKPWALQQELNTKNRLRNNAYIDVLNFRNSNSCTLIESKNYKKTFIIGLKKSVSYISTSLHNEG